MVTINSAKKIEGWDKVKDSGHREEFKTGSKRDSRVGKGRFDLLPFYALQRLARVYENGAVKYGENNWRLGQPCSRYLDSALRHLMKAGAGWKDEDHYGQAMWNIAAIIETQKMIELGMAPPELDDLRGFTPVWEEGNLPAHGADNPAVDVKGHSLINGVRKKMRLKRR
jgi:hypothetical protein